MVDKHPQDNLVRAWTSPEAISLRAGTNGDGNTMVGHFAVFDTWTEIKSMFEGNFLERIARGAFTDTFKTRGDQIRVLYDHGADPTIGNKPLGAPSVLREDKTGAYYEVPLFDSSYVNDLKPAIRSGQLGASFRFKVTGEEWVTPSEATRDNPSRLDERTITAVDLYEFGPVTFPAYAEASAGLRSRTDEFMQHFLDDPAFVARFIEQVGSRAASKILNELPARSPLTSAQFEPEPPDDDEEDGSADSDPDEDPDETADGVETESKSRRTALVQRAVAAFDAHLARIERQSQP